ncbi:hypothetical protein [Brumicola pallidula]|jgi:adenosylmethionine-8-amino-7-oxononanoate aminotransferase|uniref:hypothetical protein n=1 Tax=Brumicola pallidula TaxID=56807 RepID=UPI00047ADEBB|nr:hypothetical protein [Glaciecola pallidula]
MKKQLRKIFSPILRVFESGEGEYLYKKSDRKVLNIMGFLFVFLSGYSAVVAIIASELAGFLPFLVFFLIGFICALVGLLGNDRAVSKIWSRK